jgi:phosphatidylserine decarboxylase
MPAHTGVARLGGWLPSDQDALESWLGDLHERVESREEITLHPVIEEFHDLIERDPIVRMYLSEMVRQVPRTRKYRNNHLESVDQMLLLINEVLAQAPEYDSTSMVGVPINAILDWCMGTPAGFGAFRNDAINAMIKKILTAWCGFLSSEKSLYVLNETPSGWKCAAAQKAMNIQDYQYDPDDAYWGFTSWNDFFTRRFKKGARPIAKPDNDKVIVSACESTPYCIRTNVKREDRFWIKAQPYSLQDMLASPEIVDQFVGGTVYQAFLSALNYHRWHSPVTGTITKAFIQEGTYYSEVEAEGEDPEGPTNSQGYIAHVATRAIIFIECDDPTIGLMCVVLVGMGEVSSCVILPETKAGHRVKKGDQLGFFQFGGSTHCLVFRPGAIATFSLQAIPRIYDSPAPLVLLGTQIATAP